MTPTPPKKTQEPIKIIGKHKFYDIRLADQILYTRFVKAETDMMYIRMGLSESFLKTIMSEMKTIILDGKMSPTDLKNNLLIAVNNIDARIGMIAEKTFYEELACVYILMDDEPAELDPEWQAKKKRIWRDAGELDFFTLLAFKITNGLKDISEKDILSVWVALNERLSQTKK